MLTREQKRSKIDGIMSSVKNSSFIFFVTFSQIKTKDISVLRNNLFKTNAKMTLVKKTLADIAIRESDIKDINLKKSHKGQIALVFCDENFFSSLSFISDFKKKNKDNFQILGGIYNKAAIDEKTLSLFTSIKSIDDLYTRLVWAMKYPISQLAVALDQISKIEK